MKARERVRMTLNHQEPENIRIFGKGSVQRAQCAIKKELAELLSASSFFVCY